VLLLTDVHTNVWQLKFMKQWLLCTYVYILCIFCSTLLCQVGLGFNGLLT